jgi:hypothetical protein
MWKIRNSSPPTIAEAPNHIGEMNAPKRVIITVSNFSPNVAVPLAILWVMSPTFVAPRAQISCCAPFRVMAEVDDQMMSAKSTPSMYMRNIFLANDERMHHYQIE